MAFTNTNNMKGKLFGGCGTASDPGILITVGKKFKVLICDAGIFNCFTDIYPCGPMRPIRTLPPGRLTEVLILQVLG